MITVGDLRKILRGVPNSMPVVLGVGESLENICSANIEVIKVQYTDIEDEEYEMLLVLPVCDCEDEEIEIEETDINPELN